MANGWDEGILVEFHDESRELLDQVIGDLLALEKRWDVEGVNRIYRAFHSIKGNSAMLGYGRLSALTHELESVLGRVRDRSLSLDRDLTRLLTEAVDVLNQVLDDLMAGEGDERDCTDLLTRVKTVLRPGGRGDGVPRKTVAAESRAAREDVPVPQLRVTAPHEEGVETRDEGVPRKRILIAEDDFVSRQILLSVFGRLGDCHVAKDGIEAIGAFLAGFSGNEKPPYDLVCMDIHMPRMDGLNAIKVLRGLERGTGLSDNRREAIMVVVSAQENPRDLARQTYDAGADLFFSKPLDLRQMARALARLGVELPLTAQPSG